MEKFGVFDILNKLTKSGGIESLLNAPLNTLFNNSYNKLNNTPLNGAQNKAVSVKKSTGVSSLMNMLENHDKISKQIDAMQNKK